MSLSAFERFKNRVGTQISQQGQRGDSSLSETPGSPSTSVSNTSGLAVAAQPTKILQDVLGEILTFNLKLQVVFIQYKCFV
jgi:hypothetical protein